MDNVLRYGEITKMAYPRTRVVRLSITYNGKPIGIVQGTYSSYFGFGMTLRVMRGPIVNAETKEKFQLVGSLLKELEDYSKRKRIIQAQILVPDSWQLQEVFHKMGYASAGKIENEYIVNLEEGVEKLWKSIDHNKRRNIKKAVKEGVEIVQSHSHEDLKTFYFNARSHRRKGKASQHTLAHGLRRYGKHTILSYRRCFWHIGKGKAFQESTS